MGGEADDTSWLDPPAPPASTEDDTSWLDLSDAVPNDQGWLEVEDPNANQIPASFRHLVEACMRGTDRVMACDGSYMVYRPFNKAFDKETNPRTKERFAMFCEKGFYMHIATYDEVQVYELLPGNPYLQKKQYVLGQDRWKDIRAAASAACEKNWADYHDILGGMATAIKSGRDKIFAKAMWDETLHQVGITIAQMGGPSEREVNEGFVGVRQARGIPTRGDTIARPSGEMMVNTGGLQKVGFK
jgi:hypothetical protein